MKVVAISGGFDPAHCGHVKYIQEAKKLGDYLVVILNNDNWLMNKKGYCFMHEKDRAFIVKNIKGVDKVITTKHTKHDEDKSVCKELKALRPDIFANGGDRFADNIPELKLCNDLGIELIFNVGGRKLRSSSKLVKKYKEINKE